MINIRPFKAIRPGKDYCKSVVSLPYDVMTLEEMKKISETNPLSFLRIIRSEIDFNDNINPYSDKIYNRAKENLNEFIKKKYLIMDDTPCFYLYKQENDVHEQTGLIGNVSVWDYESGIIKEHEKTRIIKENDRIKHIETLNAQTGSVFLTYKSDDSINSILNEIKKTKPEFDFQTEDNVKHKFWVIREKNIIDEIISCFSKVKSLYIADGHHRSAAAYKVAKKRNPDKSNDMESDYFLSIIYPHDDLRILSYNRVVKGLENFNKEDFLEKIKNNFEIMITEPNEEKIGFSPKNRHEIGMYLDGEWYLLKAKNEIISDDPVLSLDVSILKEYILDPVLGIKDLRTDKRIDFVGGIRGTKYLKEKVDMNKYQMAFSMYPTSIEQLFKVADKGELMPPKSTWFSPKPRSGFVIHKLD